jgi:ATP-dependent Lhr-like helicase
MLRRRLGRDARRGKDCASPAHMLSLSRMKHARLPALPDRFEAWFERRGWTPRAHQREMVAAAQAGEDALLIAPTGGGKTLGGFLPSLIDLADIADAGGKDRPHRLHTLYISPLKALSQDVARNLMTPIEEMGLNLRVETRTGDTPASKRTRQRAKPPDILLTTPEQIALFCAQENASAFFEDLQCVIIDEVHALAPAKRGDLLALGLAALQHYAPKMRRVGLSATVKDEMGHARWLTAQRDGEESPLRPHRPRQRRRRARGRGDDARRAHPLVRPFRPPRHARCL